jgi:hypothetical protein
MELVIMSPDNGSGVNLPNKDSPSNPAVSYRNGETIADISAVFDLLREVFDRVQCLQRAIVVMCEGRCDFKAEYAEDIAELKCKLQDLGRNKVWVARDRL